MADGMREKTTNVGGVIKRIWYAMTGATQGAQLLSLDDAGNLEGKLLNPTINGTATGTAVTTTGEANKLVKTVSAGNISMTQSVDGLVAVALNNTSTGVNATTGIQLKADNDSYLSMWNYGSGRTASIFGKTIGNYSAILTQGTNNAGMLFGTLTAKDVIIGTNGSARITVAGDGSKTTFNNLIAVNTGAGDNLVLGTSSGAGLALIRNSAGVENIRFDGNTGIVKGQFQLSALSTPPASATATGTLGEIRIDANYIYVCTATNTWKRTALTTW